MKRCRFLKVLLVMLLVATMVTPNVQAAVKLNKSKATIYVGETLTLKISGTKSKATWSTSDKNVATVSTKGKVTAKSEGEVTITAKVKNKKYQCNLTVKEKTLSDLIQYLKDKELISGEPTNVAYGMIGAIDGIKYLDSGVELYVFDTSSEVYKNMIDTMTVPLEGFNIDLDVSAINNEFVIFCDSEDVIDAFLEY